MPSWSVLGWNLPLLLPLLLLLLLLSSSGYFNYNLCIFWLEYNILRPWRFWDKNNPEIYLQFISWLECLSGPRPPRRWGFAVSLRHTALGWTRLDEWSACRRNLYITTHYTFKRQISIRPAGFEPKIPPPKKKPAAADPYLRPRGYWNRRNPFLRWDILIK